MAVQPREHDPAAFEDLWACRERVRAVCLGIVRDRATADDLVQDTYLRALTTMRPPDRRGSLMSWLAVVARHRAIDKLRADSHERAADAVIGRVPSEGGDPADHMVQREALDRVRRALLQLDGRDRRLLVEHVVQGLPLSELAVRERTTEASVRSTLWRARQKLRVAVERGGPLGVAPTERLAGPLRRLRSLYTRVETSGPTLFLNVAMHLVEAAATALVAAVLVLGSSGGGFAMGPFADAAPLSANVPRSPVSVPARPPEVIVGAHLAVGEQALRELRPEARARVGVGTEIGPWKGGVGFDGKSNGKTTELTVSVGLSTPVLTVPEKEVSLEWNCGPEEENRFYLPAGYTVDGCPPLWMVVEAMEAVDAVGTP